MTKTDKEAKQADLRQQAKDLQARLGFLTLQIRNLRKEVAGIRTVLEYQEGQFSQLQQAPVDD